MAFFRASLVDQHTAEWQFEHFEFLIIELSTGTGLSDAELQLPHKDNFTDTNNPAAKYEGHDLAEFLLSRVQEQCGINIKIKLTPTRENKPVKLGSSAVMQPLGKQDAAAGRYIVRQNNDGDIIEEITYDEDHMQDPAMLIGTFAHELSHCLHNRMKQIPEFEENILYEMFTDLTAVYLGYGVFLANGRSNSTSNNEGWSTNATGYLSESELIFATALFMRIKNISIDTPQPYLKPYLFKMLKKAMKQLGGYGNEIDFLRTLKPRSKTG